jgi:hypothetical protein
MSLDSNSGCKCEIGCYFGGNRKLTQHHAILHDIQFHEIFSHELLD